MGSELAQRSPIGSAAPLFALLQARLFEILKASPKRFADETPVLSLIRAQARDAQLTRAKLRHKKYGASSEWGRKLIDQLELQLPEIKENAAQDATTAKLAATEPRARK